MARRRCRPFLLAVILLSLLAQLPDSTSVALDSHLLHGGTATDTSVNNQPQASAGPMGARDDAASSAAGHILRAPILPLTLRDGSATPRRLDKLLPLLAFALLPRPVAAMVALSAVASSSLVRAEFFDDEYFKINQATCAVYPYDNATGTIDRNNTFNGLRLRDWCFRPLCTDVHAQFRVHERFAIYHNLGHHVRWDDDPLRLYCAVQTPEDGRTPPPRAWWIKWRTLLPVADPDAAAASGDSVCYVELAHMEYREGYYIRCPAGGRHFRVWCTEFPVEEVVSAVWERRSLTYRDTVGSKCEGYRQRARGAQ